MNKQPNISLPAYKHYPSRTGGEGIIARDAPSRENRPGDFPPSLDPPKNKCGESRPSPKVKSRPKFCRHSPGEFRHKDGRVLPAPCNSWNCDFCAPKKKAKLMNRLQHGQETGGLRWRSLTLTQQIADPMPIMLAWALMRRALADEGYRHIKFVLTKEFTRAGKRHLHILINAYLPHSMLKRLWLQVTAGSSYIVDIRSCNDVRSLAGYMSKYIIKAIEREDQFEKGEHRYSFSQWIGWHVTSAPSEPGWSFVYMPVLRVGAAYLDMDLINEMRARRLRKTTLTAYLKDERAVTAAIASCSLDALQRHTGTPIDSLPWDDRGRLYLS